MNTVDKTVTVDGLDLTLGRRSAAERVRRPSEMAAGTFGISRRARVASLPSWH